MPMPDADAEEGALPGPPAGVLPVGVLEPGLRVWVRLTWVSWVRLDQVSNTGSGLRRAARAGGRRELTWPRPTELCHGLPLWQT